LDKITYFSQLKERYSQMKSESHGVDVLKELRAELKLLKKSLKDDWREWSKLSHSILDSRPENYKGA
jgi:hypothetical protein